MAAIEGTGGASRGRKPKREQHIGKPAVMKAPARKPTKPVSSRAASRRSSPAPKAPKHQMKSTGDRSRHQVKATGSRNKAPRAVRQPSSQQAAMVGLNAYRGYADRMAHLRANPDFGGGLGVNLNPFDAIGNLGRGLGDALTNLERNLPNPGQLIIREGEKIKKATSR